MNLLVGTCCLNIQNILYQLVKTNPQKWSWFIPSCEFIHPQRRALEAWGDFSFERRGGGVAILLFLPDFKTNLTEMSNLNDCACH